MQIKDAFSDKRSFKNLVIGIWYNVYLFRGGQKLFYPISLILSISTLVAVLVGKSNILIYVASLSLISLITFLVITLYGRWDYSGKGTRFVETKRWLESDWGMSLTIAQYKQMKLISEKLGTPLDETFMKKYEWLIELEKRNRDNYE